MKNITHNHESIDSILIKAGSKKTGPRFEILEVLAHSKKPISIKEIHQKVSKKGVDLATIFRVVKSFSKKNVIRQIDFGHDKSYFELNDSKNDHHHIICTNCHKVADFVGCEAESLMKIALRQNKDFARVDRHSFEFYGLCQSCVKHV
jgi:Fe2+ or Zn2+ uptake regulation protein